MRISLLRRRMLQATLSDPELSTRMTAMVHDLDRAAPAACLFPLFEKLHKIERELVPLQRHSQAGRCRRWSTHGRETPIR
jgi:hypothetical protein